MFSQSRRTTARIAAVVAAVGLSVPVAGPALADPAGPSGADTRTTTVRPAQLDRELAKIEDAGAIGVTAEVVDGDRRWRGAAGLAERGPDRAASERARFRAASVSKMLVTTLAMQQVESGRWSLGTTLGEVLPGVWPQRDGTTVRQLLGHTSGIPDYLAPLVATADTAERFQAAISKRRTDAELVRVAKKVKPTVQPGTFSYSNTNYVLAGMMLERTTGRPLERLVEKRVLRPARMTQSSWATTPRLERPRLKEYARLEKKVVDLAMFEPSMFSGAGALVSTARDLNRFQQALSSGRLVDHLLVREMRRVLPATKGQPMEYGLGSYRLPDPCAPGRFVHGHDGGSWATLTMSFASPRGDRRVTVSMTGRDYDGSTASAQALFSFATTALAQACGGKPVEGAETATPKQLAPAAGALATRG